MIKQEAKQLLGYRQTFISHRSSTMGKQIYIGSNLIAQTNKCWDGGYTPSTLQTMPYLWHDLLSCLRHGFSHFLRTLSKWLHVDLCLFGFVFDLYRVFIMLIVTGDLFNVTGDSCGACYHAFYGHISNAIYYI